MSLMLQFNGLSHNHFIWSDRLHLVEVIGECTSGVVFLAKWWPSPQASVAVALKIPKRPSPLALNPQRTITREASIMEALGGAPHCLTQFALVEVASLRPLLGSMEKPSTLLQVQQESLPHDATALLLPYKPAGTLRHLEAAIKEQKRTSLSNLDIYMILHQVCLPKLSHCTQ